MVAASNGHERVVDTLIGAGADLELRDDVSVLSDTI